MATTANTTGITLSGIGKVKSALDNYRAAVIKKCNVSATAAQVQAAIKGSTSENTLKAMANAIDTKMKDYIRQLNQYDNLLDEMKSSYVSNDQNNSSFTDVSKKISEA